MLFKSSLVDEREAKNDARREKLFRLKFQPPEDFNAAEWRTDYMDNVWKGDTNAVNESLTEIAQCLTVSPYWDDMSMDAQLYAQNTSALMQEFRVVATSIDQKMLRDKVVNVLTSELGGLPYRKPVRVSTSFQRLEMTTIISQRLPTTPLCWRTLVALTHCKAVLQRTTGLMTMADREVGTVLEPIQEYWDTLTMNDR